MRTSTGLGSSENYRKRNGLLRYSRDTDGDDFSITVQGYEGGWRSTDQIPLRAVQSGAIDRFGTVDPTDGGHSHRYSLSARSRGALGGGQAKALLYAVDYHLDLISNFSYFIDPERGDQFQQVDERQIYGGEWSWRRGFEWLNRTHAFASGVQVRHDNIQKVGLYRTMARALFDTTREDAVRQTSYGIFGSLDTRWSQHVRTTACVRIASRSR